MKSIKKFVIKTFNLMFDNDVNDWVKTLIKMKNDIKDSLDLSDLCDLIVFY